MPAVVVRNEAGDRFDTLAERIEAIAAETLPLVEAVTGLPLPHPVVIRTMTVRNWTREHTRSIQRRLLVEAEEFQPSPEEAHVAAERQKSMLKTLRAYWPLMGGQAVTFKPGQSEVVILPEALRHAAQLHDTPFLSKLLAHAPTRLAQYVASEGTVWAAQDTFFPALRGVEGRDYGFLLEGHAYWAAQQITTKIFGEPVSTQQVPEHATARYRDLFASMQARGAEGQLRRAADSVGHIIAVDGLARFNRVWKSPELVPTVEEAASGGASWQGRFSGDD
jgi:hypothetical protein